MAEKFDVIVIGGGTAGLVTASGCSRLGRRTALISREPLGGDCLWTGCVPTKSLVATASLIQKMKSAEYYGLDPHHPVIDPQRIMKSMRTARARIEPHDDPEKFRDLGIDVIFEHAELLSAGRVRAGSRTFDAKNIVIATGARTFVPPVKGLEETGYMDHRSFLEQDQLPGRIVVMGGGAIGIEFAQIFRRFGSEVTVVELFDEILLREDQDVISRVRSILEKEGITIRTGWKVTQASRISDGKLVTIESGSGEIERIEVDEIFVSAGRRGNHENMGLEQVGVKVKKNHVVVDEYLGTTADGVWAVGDIKGPPQFTHVAAYEAVKLVRNMLFPGRSKISYDHIPWGVYTDPEVAHIGLTQKEAEEAHGADGIRIYAVEMADLDRAVTERTSQGFLKVILDRKGRILGAHAVCTHATTLIQEIVVARQNGLKITSLTSSVSSYPSLADAVRKIGTLYYQDLGQSWLGSIARRVASWS
ncbi:MAG: FAD-dependent oxidoreductase [Acidobacteria bacterium]|nr:FAD-dependent oxidoreductase [Acidobacteriota bacterium]